MYIMGDSNLIFIDSNIYLRFYDSNASEFKRLLYSLSEIKDNILVTSQVVGEIDKNKLRVFSDSLKTYFVEKAINKSFLPEHFDGDIERIKNWNEKLKQLLNDARSLNKELDLILNDLLIDVAFSKDQVSLLLNGIFSSPIFPTIDEIEQAQLRKSLGEPPGKPGNSIGDALNWVVLLRFAKQIDHLWIVTNDQDYFSEYCGRQFLNPYMLKEILTQNPRISVSIFNKLSNALQEFNELHAIQSLPNGSDLQVILSEEPDTHLHPNWKAKASGPQNFEDVYCPMCHYRGVFHLGEINSKDGLKIHCLCPACEMNFYVEG